MLPGLLKDMEAPPVDDIARARLERLIYWHGADHVTLLVKAIIESEGNQDALVEPVISAVSSVMSFKPEWPNRGGAWIEAFDKIPLVTLLRTLRGLKIFQPGGMGESQHYLVSLRNQLWEIFEPPVPPKPPKPPKLGPKTTRKRGVTKGKPTS
jgi:hypothetical protein